MIEGFPGYFAQSRGNSICRTGHAREMDMITSGWAGESGVAMAPLCHVLRADGRIWAPV